MSKFPAWFPTRNEVDAFLASKPNCRSYSTDGVMEQDHRHRRITWAAHQALAWANANPAANKAAILRKIHDVLNPINWEGMMKSHCACLSQTRDSYVMTPQGVRMTR